MWHFKPINYILLGYYTSLRICVLPGFSTAWGIMPLLSLMGSRWMSSFSGSVCKRLGTFSYFSITLSCFRFLMWTGSLKNMRQTKWTSHVNRQDPYLTSWIKWLPLTQARVLFHLSFLPFCASPQQSGCPGRPVKPPWAVLPWRTTSNQQPAGLGSSHWVTSPEPALTCSTASLPLTASWPSRWGLTRTWQQVGRRPFLSTPLHSCFYHYHFSALPTGKACVTHPSPMTTAITQRGVAAFHRYAPELHLSVQEGKYSVFANMSTQFVSAVISEKVLTQIVADQSKADWKGKYSNLREHYERN